MINHYKKLTFNHANLKRPVSIVAGTIAAWHWSEANACMLIYTTAGILPVSETDEEISEKIELLNNSPIGQESSNVRPATV